MKTASVFFLFTIGVLCSEAAAQTTFTSNLPILLIDTHGVDIPDDPKIIADLKIIDHGNGALNTSSDDEFTYNGLIGIELRGSASQNSPKKPYGFETLLTPEQDQDVPLLGMPAGDDWVLNAAYDDKTLIRDVLAYRMGRSEGRYASRTRYCELVLNGSYEGIYIVQEKIERDKYRVNIPKIEPSASSGDKLTGGYVIKIDKTTGSGGEGWYSLPPPDGTPVYFQFDYPKPEEITDVQRDYIINYTKAFENSLFSDDFRDPENGYAKYMDAASMVDFLIMNEVSKNPDGLRISTFFYKKRDSDGGKLFMGPIWDFNLGFGNTRYCTGGSPEGYAFHFNLICGNDKNQVPFWWKRVLTDDSFMEKLNSRWKMLRAGVFQTGEVHRYIDSAAAVMTAGGATGRNFERWPLHGNTDGDTFAGSVMVLKDWAKQRMEWLDKNLPNIVTGITEPRRPFEMTVFPNPTPDIITAEGTSNRGSLITFEMFDALGRTVDSGSTGTADGIYRSVFNLKALPPGIYFLKGSGLPGTIVTKVIKR